MARNAALLLATFAFSIGSTSRVAAQSQQTAHAAHAEAQSRDSSPNRVALRSNLGSWHRSIRTSEPLAQQYFDQGLRLYYGFNHAEAVRAFREAQRIDPECVMCIWGEAVALGPNINAPMDSAAERMAIAATRRALELVSQRAAALRVDERLRDGARKVAPSAGSGGPSDEIAERKRDRDSSGGRDTRTFSPSCVACTWEASMWMGTSVPVTTEHAPSTHNHTRADGGRNAPNREAAFVYALAARYLDLASTTRAGRDSAYATAMSAIADGAPHDMDAQALAAEAAMDLSPWNYWNVDGTPRLGTERALDWLTRALRVEPKHPGACHFYIHAVEAAYPERTVACAERLAALMPGAGHIVHMPAHIYIRVGRWADAIESNRHAVHADDQYFEGPHTPDAAFYSAMYRSHNHHFLTLAAVMSGQSALAIQASRDVAALVSPELARQVAPLQPLLAFPTQTLVTFGRWEEVLRTPMPPSDLRMASALMWYARGVAFAATDRASEARAMLDSIKTVSSQMASGEPRMVLEIAAHAVAGEIALRSGDANGAVTQFTAGVRIEDQLAYMEPPTWYYPVRHSLGKALLAAGRAPEAELAYLEDLRRFPENGWALKGLALAMRAQRRMDDAAKVEQRFERAWRNADVKLGSSRY